VQPLVSILIPAYNAEEWIADTIQSAIGQTWARKEIIIVDDGSRDQTVNVARRFESKTVLVISKENQGAAAARNYALNMSQGDYVQWLDADDLLAPDKVESQIAALQQSGGNRTLLSSSWAFFNYRPQRAQFVPTSLWQDLSPVEWLFRKMAGNLYMQTATWLTSRELCEAAGLWDTRLLSDDDGEYFCRVLLRSQGTLFVRHAKVFYRNTPSNRLGQIGASDEKKNAMLISMRLHMQYLRSLEDSDRTRLACLTYMQNWLDNFSPERPDIVAELQKIASELHGSLEEPGLRWKYAWIKPILGRKAAKWAQLALPQFKASLVNRWDKRMYRLESGKALLRDGAGKIRLTPMRTIANHGVKFEADASVSESRGVSAGGTTSNPASEISLALLTGGIDLHYAYGLATSLGSNGATIDVIGSDELDEPELRHAPGVTFLNLRGDQRPNTTLMHKVVRVSEYYARLIRYAASSRADIFHILWNNRFEVFDRTLLILYYKFLGKKVVLTAHNVNTHRRDAKDTVLNRLTLRIQYRLADHVFVHTDKMKSELVVEFGVPETRVTIIPYGINNAVPHTSLSPKQARQRLGLHDRDKVILFFGRITPYKGLDYLVGAFQRSFAAREEYRLIVAGGLQPGCEEYGHEIQKEIQTGISDGRIIFKPNFIPDEEIELYFKAADVLVLPYRHIYQSGVLFLGYSFGLPVLVAEVGNLKHEIVEGETGFVFKPDDSCDLARAIDRYFASDLFANLGSRREHIEEFAKEHHSWDVVGQLTMNAYADLLRER
jgi:glycosyltransferase involved in cell wall biosynthesis